MKVVLSWSPMKTRFLLMALSLTACGDDRPPAPTAEESEQLNEVEELLNEEAAKEEGPENRSPGPSG
jgi:hypothetical protein